MTVSYSLPSSDQSMRIQMELAFDEIFGNGNKPLFSRK